MLYNTHEVMLYNTRLFCDITHTMVYNRHYMLRYKTHMLCYNT